MGGESTCSYMYNLMVGGGLRHHHVMGGESSYNLMGGGGLRHHHVMGGESSYNLMGEGVKTSSCNGWRK